tara:strand:+ start:819 stop:1013 length:195 start_codon:yes stop_codon:yes gene_type:complete
MNKNLLNKLKSIKLYKISFYGFFNLKSDIDNETNVIYANQFEKNEIINDLMAQGYKITVTLCNN